MAFYIARKVLNVQEVKRLLPFVPVEDELHVTQFYSEGTFPQIHLRENRCTLNVKASIENWKSTDGLDIVVCKFDSMVLAYRFEELTKLGLVYTFPEYNAHVTLCQGVCDQLISVPLFLMLSPEYVKETHESQRPDY